MTQCKRDAGRKRLRQKRLTHDILGTKSRYYIFCDCEESWLTSMMHRSMGKGRPGGGVP